MVLIRIISSNMCGQPFMMFHAGFSNGKPDVTLRQELATSFESEYDALSYMVDNKLGGPSYKLITVPNL